MTNLKSRIIKTEPANWRKFQFIQQEDFKSLDPEAMSKLKQSILNDSFIQPFYVWMDNDGAMYCLDGKHRTLALEELNGEGFVIPEMLPTTFVECENKQEAAKLVLKYSSIYAKITQQGLYDFLQVYELEFDEIRDQIDLPELSETRFEQKFDLYDIENAEEPEVIVEEALLIKPGDIIELNGHRIICGSFTSAEDVAALMEGKKARQVNCDPPYNLPANFFTNKDHDRHKDFAMGAGEMSDDEFVDFLALIMQRSAENTLDGAIHYIFMDWRHMWHMTEAGRRVYGSPIPKQMCVWNKDLMANGSFYRAQQELCFVFNNPQSKALWHRDIVDRGGFYKDEDELCFIFKSGEAKHLSHLELKNRIRTNVWSYPSATSIANPDRYELKNHPTPKPVSMIADAILDTTNKGEIVIDWFLGSGTCLMACEHTKRIGRFTEIEPNYVESAVIRYINYCHKRNLSIKFTHLNGNLKLEDFYAKHNLSANEKCNN